MQKVGILPGESRYIEETAGKKPPPGFANGIVGVITFNREFKYTSYQDFRDDEPRHCIPVGSAFDWDPCVHKEMYGWEVEYVVPFKNRLHPAQSKGIIGAKTLQRRGTFVPAPSINGSEPTSTAHRLYVQEPFRLYVQQRDLNQHGYTDGCPKCDFITEKSNEEDDQNYKRYYKHSETCRQRLTAKIEKTAEIQKRIAKQRRVKYVEGPPLVCSNTQTRQQPSTLPAEPNLDAD